MEMSRVITIALHLQFVGGVLVQDRHHRRLGNFRPRPRSLGAQPESHAPNQQAQHLERKEVVLVSFIITTIVTHILITVNTVKKNTNASTVFR